MPRSSPQDSERVYGLPTVKFLPTRIFLRESRDRIVKLGDQVLEKIVVINPRTTRVRKVPVSKKGPSTWHSSLSSEIIVTSNLGHPVVSPKGSNAEA